MNARRPQQWGVLTIHPRSQRQVAWGFVYLRSLGTRRPRSRRPTHSPQHVP